jgi:SAM-dependent methyltransferase
MSAPEGRTRAAFCSPRESAPARPHSHSLLLEAKSRLEFEEFKIMYEAEDTHWWYRGLRGVMFELLGLDDPRTRSLEVLDAGCGTGGTLQALRNAGFLHLHGFDLNPPALHFCRQRGLEQVKLGSITDIPFPDNEFNVVISNDVLNDAGTSSEAAALSELYRVLRPGGRLFLNLPAFGFLRSEHDRATDVARRYTRSEITRMLQGCGFIVRRVTYWNMFLFPVVVAVRLMRREREEDLSNPARSDIVVPPEPANGLLSTVMLVERALIKKIALPFGSSVAVMAQKPRPDR